MAYFPQVALWDRLIGKTALVTPTNALVVQEPIRLCGAAYGASIDSTFWVAANNGAASASGVASGIATVTSGTANSGYGSLNTVKKGRFLYGNANLFRGSYRLTATGGANSTRRWGAINFTVGSPPTIQNGFYFSYDGSTSSISVNCVSNSVVNSVSSGSFNGEVASYTVDTNIHAYEIIYFVMGAWFYIDGVLVHKFTPTTAVLAQDLGAPVFFEAVNSAGGTTSVTLECWNTSIFRYGKELSVPSFKNITTNTTTVCKIGAGTLLAVVINKPAGNTNTITLYDNTAASGTVIGTINNAPGAIVTLEFLVPFNLGLTVLTQTGVAGDLTVLFD